MYCTHVPSPCTARMYRSPCTACLYRVHALHTCTESMYCTPVPSPCTARLLLPATCRCGQGSVHQCRTARTHENHTPHGLHPEPQVPHGVHPEPCTACSASGTRAPHRSRQLQPSGIRAPPRSRQLQPQEPEHPTRAGGYSHQESQGTGELTPACRKPGSAHHRSSQLQPRTQPTPPAPRVSPCPGTRPQRTQRGKTVNKPRLPSLFPSTPPSVDAHAPIHVRTRRQYAGSSMHMGCYPRHAACIWGATPGGGHQSAAWRGRGE